MSFGREFVTEVIELYKEQVCLWRTTDPGYHDKNLRSAAVEKLLALFRTKDPDATKEVVLKKIGSMRGSFRKEYNKVKASERSGTGADQLHIPKLWYYNLMMFLEDQEVPRQSRSVHSIFDDMPFDDDEESISETGSQLVNGEGSTSPPSSTPMTSRGFKRARCKKDDILDKIANKLDAPVHSETKVPAPFDYFGNYVAERLRSMGPDMQPICQKLISDVIFLADIKKLNETSHVVTEPLTPRTTVAPLPRTLFHDR